MQSTVSVMDSTDSVASLVDGITDLTDDVMPFTDGAADLTDGARDLTDGARDLTDGARDLTDGAADLTDGAADLTDGAADLTDDVTPLTNSVTESVNCAAQKATVSEKTTHFPAKAGYVQSKHGNDMAVLLSSGFHAVSMNRAQSALPAPSITDILNGITGQLLPRIPPIANANGYEPRYAAIGADGTPGPWVGGGVFSNTRDLAINGLTPGTTYLIPVRAVGGINQYSDWSDPVSHMCM